MLRVPKKREVGKVQLLSWRILWIIKLVFGWKIPELNESIAGGLQFSWENHHTGGNGDTMWSTGLG